MRKFLCAALVFLVFGCNKSHDDVTEKNTGLQDPFNDFVLYSIAKGEHFTTNNFYTPAEISQLKFIARFDSSAIYQTRSEENQYDINKLYGFSDNNADHHHYSARFGWNWTNSALRLYGYVYNEGKLLKKEIGTVQIGEPIYCSIKADKGNYIFDMNDTQVKMPRSSTCSIASGYLLYPYFGGDETAPHDIKIWIKNL